jgi:N-acetylglucosamine kinase-like BadF-type ATPase
MTAPFVIGIDGGGTCSRAIAMSIDGEPLGEVNGGPLNYNTTSPAKFRESLADIIQQFSDGHDLGSVAEQVVIGTASLFTSLDVGEATNVCGGLLPSDRLKVVGDVVTALYGATLGAPGLLVISGTGSIAAAIDGDGCCHTTGGLGPSIGGDPGSAYWIANEVLLHASVESCNGTQSTGLTDLICRYFNISEFKKLVPAIYSEVESAKRLAGLSRFIATSDFNGQPFWLSILRRAGVRLAKLCEPLAAKLDSTKWLGTVHASGSVLVNNGHVRESFVAELSTKAKRTLTVESPALSAVEGAALMALKKIAPTRVDEVAARLVKRKS